MHGTGAEEDALAEIEETALRIDREIRSFAFSHYPATIGHEGLGAALQYLARGFGVRTGLCVKFTDRCQDKIGDGPVAIALLRVAQEALTNVHRHAGAAHVRVNLAISNDMIELSVRDDGRGIGSEFESGAFSGVVVVGADCGQGERCFGGEAPGGIPARFYLPHLARCFGTARGRSVNAFDWIDRRW